MEMVVFSVSLCCGGEGVELWAWRGRDEELRGKTGEAEDEIDKELERAKPRSLGILESLGATGPLGGDSTAAEVCGVVYGGGSSGE